MFVTVQKIYGLNIYIRSNITTLNNEFFRLSHQAHFIKFFPVLIKIFSSPNGMKLLRLRTYIAFGIIKLK